jgi:hypothetical protein
MHLRQTLRGVFDLGLSELLKEHVKAELFEIVERFREPSADVKCTTEDALKAKLICDLLFLKLAQDHARAAVSSP